MTKILKWVLLGALICGLAAPVSCSKKQSPDTESVAVHRILFHISYENYAWGYSGYGYYVDDEGNVWKMTTPNHWWAEEMNIIEGKSDRTLYEADDLEQSYLDSQDCIVCHINVDPLEEQHDLIEKAAGGDYSTPASTGCDMGSWVTGCLHYDQATDKYEKVILSVSGDWSAHNLDPSAATLTGWLDKSLTGCPFPWTSPGT